MKKAFEILGHDLKIPLIGNVPHSSTYIEPELRQHISLSDSELQLEIERMTDWYTDDLFSTIQSIGGRSVKANHSRLVLDTERYEDDSLEMMVSRGMGVIYTATSQNTPLRPKLDPATRELYLSTIYRPYHRALAEEVGLSLKLFSRCLIIDCHSFPSEALPYEIDQRPERPEICIGTDRSHSPDEVVKKVVKLCSREGVTVDINRPFGGSMVPAAHYGNKSVNSFMIEVRRDLYINEETAARSTNFDACRALVEKIIGEIFDSFNESE